MKQETFPRIELRLIELLDEMYPVLAYDPDISTETFARRSAFRAGQIELINKLKAIYNKQKESGGIYGR
tara:strand:- start:3100 stop:3306 length:207 start_codon:yes stop_codon:yes gene_type:complete